MLLVAPFVYFIVGHWPKKLELKDPSKRMNTQQNMHRANNTDNYPGLHH